MHTKRTALTIALGFMLALTAFAPAARAACNVNGVTNTEFYYWRDIATNSPIDDANPLFVCKGCVTNFYVTVTPPAVSGAS
ncbi:MAG: hypothetical protein WCN95_11295, partial [bacterium]